MGVDRRIELVDIRSKDEALAAPSLARARGAWPSWYLGRTARSVERVTAVRQKWVEVVVDKGCRKRRRRERWRKFSRKVAGFNES